MCLIIEYFRDIFLCFSKHIFTNDNEAQAWDTEVFSSAGVDHAKVRPVNGFAPNTGNVTPDIPIPKIPDAIINPVFVDKNPIKNDPKA